MKALVVIALVPVLVAADSLRPPSITIYSGGVKRGQATAIDFNQNLSCALTGSKAVCDASASGPGGVPAYADAAGVASTALAVPWSGVSSPPATYAPTAHTHPGSEVSSAVGRASDADAAVIATTAKALAADPADCVGAGEFAKGISAAGVASGCAVPPGTYTHPASHPPSIITQDASNRFVTDTEKGTWNGKMAAFTWPTCSGTDKLTSAGSTPTCAADQTGAGGGIASTAGVGTEIQLRATATTLSAYAGTSCTNQFPRSLNASGAATCASVDLSADTAATALPVTKGGNGLTNRTANGIVVGTGPGTVAEKTLPSCSNATTSKLLYDNATQTFSCGTDQTAAASGPTAVKMTQDRVPGGTITTGQTTTDLTWAIGANEGQNFTCTLTSTSTAASKIRYAVAGPASMTYVNCRHIAATTSLTTLVANTIQAQWASTCTGCTGSVTASVLTSKLTDVLHCNVVNGANAGNITIYFAASAAANTNTLHKGSGCIIHGG